VSQLAPDDGRRSMAFADPDDPALTHLAVVGDTYTVLLSGEDTYVRDEIAAVVEAAGGRTVKVIFENAYLTDERKIRACELTAEAGAHFVKTSTGFGPGGATVADVALMRRVVGADMGVKAAGGVKDFASLEAMVAAGATRVGASAGVRIVQQSRGASPTTPSPAGY